MKQGYCIQDLVCERYLVRSINWNNNHPAAKYSLLLQNKLPFKGIGRLLFLGVVSLRLSRLLLFPLFLSFLLSFRHVRLLSSDLFTKPACGSSMEIRMGAGLRRHRKSWVGLARGNAHLRTLLGNFAVSVLVCIKSSTNYRE